MKPGTSIMSNQTWRQRLHHFFFAEEIPWALALIRIVLPWVMIAMMLPRWPYTRELFSVDGATAPLGIGYGYPDWLPEFSAPVMIALHTWLLMASVSLSLGWCTRLSAGVCFLVYTYLSLLDTISTLTKYTVITTHVLLLLTVSPCGAVWSLDAWWARRRGQPLPRKHPVWSRRLMQLMIGFVYFGAAITKINTPEFLSGDQLLFWMLTHINFRHPLGEWLTLYPVLMRLAGYIVVVWEMMFVFLVWHRLLRPWVLAVGVLFHLMTVLTLGLMIFPLVCFTCYLAYLEPADMRGLKRVWLRILARLPGGIRERWYHLLAQASQRGARRSLPAGLLPAAWGVAAVLVMVLGLMGEYYLDLYVQRRPQGRPALKPLDPALAEKFLAPTQQIREIDKFFALDTGTLLAGDLLVDRRQVFYPGQRLIAQCHLIPPHEDMWLECHVRDEDNRLVSRMGMVVLREQFRANFPFEITSAWEPGWYSLVIECRGQEVLRRKFRVAGSSQVASR
ncbi:MAG: hypothetical protein KatS3mg113_0205 [Planctomycetaceae bacterium]|nr:MAG: hypothetical protein KatS3mg113_0205 [Planctomycetaceae bacterium]